MGEGDAVVLIGVDGGGSQTTAVVTDTVGHPLGVGRSGGANHQGIGADASVAHIGEAITEALKQAQAVPTDVVFVQYGLAGADREHDFRILKPALARLPFSRWEVVSDAWIGLRAGTSNYVGVSVVCGSGTNAVGRDAHERQVQVGGFGYEFGDTAGGRHLALEGFRASVRAYQGRGPATILTTLVAEYLGLESMDAVYNHFLDCDTPIPLELAEVVHEAASIGDAVATKLLIDMGRELGIAACAVMDQLSFSETPIPIVLVGSVVQKGQSPHLLGALSTTVASRHPNAYLKPLEVSPVFGAIGLALDRVGGSFSCSSKQLFQQWGEL